MDVKAPGTYWTIASHHDMDYWRKKREREREREYKIELEYIIITLLVLTARWTGKKHEIDHQPTQISDQHAIVSRTNNERL